MLFGDWAKSSLAEWSLLFHGFPLAWMTRRGTCFLTVGISPRSWCSGLVCDGIRALLLIHGIDVICTQAHKYAGNKKKRWGREWKSKNGKFHFKKKKRNRTHKAQETLLCVLCRVRLPTMHAGSVFIPLNINTAFQEIWCNVTCVSVMAEIPPPQTKREDAFQPGCSTLCLLCPQSAHTVNCSFI